MHDEDARGPNAAPTDERARIPEAYGVRNPPSGTHDAPFLDMVTVVSSSHRHAAPVSPEAEEEKEEQPPAALLEQPLVVPNLPDLGIRAKRGKGSDWYYPTGALRLSFRDRIRRRFQCVWGAMRTGRSLIQDAEREQAQEAALADPDGEIGAQGPSVAAPRWVDVTSRVDAERHEHEHEHWVMTGNPANGSFLKARQHTAGGFAGELPTMSGPPASPGAGGPASPTLLSPGRDGALSPLAISRRSSRVAALSPLPADREHRRGGGTGGGGGGGTVTPTRSLPSLQLLPAASASAPHHRTTASSHGLRLREPRSPVLERLSLAYGHKPPSPSPIQTSLYLPAHMLRRPTSPPHGQRQTPDAALAARPSRLSLHDSPSAAGAAGRRPNRRAHTSHDARPLPDAAASQRDWQRAETADDARVRRRPDTRLGLRSVAGAASASPARRVQAVAGEGRAVHARTTATRSPVSRRGDDVAVTAGGERCMYLRRVHPRQVQRALREDCTLWRLRDVHDGARSVLEATPSLRRPHDKQVRKLLEKLRIGRQSMQVLLGV